MNIFAITVTYGDRSSLVEKLVERLLLLGVEGIVVVDNGSVENSNLALAALADRLERLHLLSFDKNLGSAGGFKKGLEFATHHSSCDYIWLLDDDNLPDLDALTALQQAYRTVAPGSCLISLRKDRIYRKVKSDVDVKRKFRCNNSFIDYSLRNWFRRKWLALHPRQNRDIIPVPYAPYGGLFFPKGILESVGYPMEELFLYMDDHEFTMRMTRVGIPIFLVRTSRVADMESSWHAQRKYAVAHRFRTLIDGDPNKLFLLLRNSMYLERKYFVTNRAEYHLNKWLFKTFYFAVSYLTGNPKATEIFKRADAASRNLT